MINDKWEEKCLKNKKKWRQGNCGDASSRNRQTRTVPTKCTQHNKYFDLKKKKNPAKIYNNCRVHYFLSLHLLTTHSLSLSSLTHYSVSLSRFFFFSLCFVLDWTQRLSLFLGCCSLHSIFALSHYSTFSFCIFLMKISFTKK